MKGLLILIFCASLGFGLEPVRRDKNDDPGTKIKVVKHETEHSDSKVRNDNDNNKDKDKDCFIDVDSNSVNDQREDDLQMIKRSMSKFKNLFKGKPETKEQVKKQAPKKSR